MLVGADSKTRSPYSVSWVVVIALGGLLKVADLDPVPQNVFTFSYIAQLAVLKEAACSINHGGIHTINECIHFKVPMLVYSGKRSDQNGCAARVAYHQLGLMADKDSDGPEVIKEKIEEVLTNEQFREKVADMHNHYLKYKADHFVEQIISSFLQTN